MEKRKKGKQKEGRKKRKKEGRKRGRENRKRKEGRKGGKETVVMWWACVRVGEGYKSIKVKSFASYTGEFK